MRYIEGYTPSVYEYDDTRNLRFALGNYGEKTLICIGINPSSASDQESDRTMNELIKFSKTNGYDSCIMINPCPIRSARPSDLPKDSEMDGNITRMNLECIEKVLTQCVGCDALIMWGNFVTSRTYFTKSSIAIMELLLEYHITAKHIERLSNAGNPYHFTYLLRGKNSAYRTGRYDINELNISEYIDKLKASL